MTVGIHDREMLETWYEMTSRLLSGLDISPASGSR
jgi:hypothetical protein